MKKYILGSIVLCLCVGALYLWKGNGSDQTKRNASGSALVIRPAALERGRLNVDVSATGVINPINVVEVKSKASGLVEKIPIEASDVVHSGQLIARLDQTDTRNALEQAIADSQVASAVLIQQENNWRRAKDLFEKNLLAQSEYDQINVEYVRAKATLVKSQSNLVLARQKMAETTVRSPIDGIVLSRTVSEGQIVASAVSNAGGGTTIARLAAMDRVYLTAAVDEVDIGKIRVGQRGRIVADAYPGDVFFGEVVRVAAQSTVIQNVTTFDVILLVPNRG
ncbi:MAG TPA: efflux RND transporter periplasmic adaptor subunit, partial [bacterium]|nr:efflux RND transporter periplasmic adaptor subunit [bacterium]